MTTASCCRSRRARCRPRPSGSSRSSRRRRSTRCSAAALIGTPLFGTRFRHCAIRALFIPRMYARPAHARLPAAAQGRRAAGVGAADSPSSRSWPRRCASASTTPSTCRGSSACSSACTTARCGRATWTRRCPRPSSTRCCSPGTGPTSTPATPRSGAATRSRCARRGAWRRARCGPRSSRRSRRSCRRPRPSGGRATPTSWPAILDDLGDLTDAEIAARVVADARAPGRGARRRAPDRRARLRGGRRAWIPATDAALYAALADRRRSRAPGAARCCERGAR